MTVGGDGGGRGDDYVLLYYTTAITTAVLYCSNNAAVIQLPILACFLFTFLVRLTLVTEPSSQSASLSSAAKLGMAPVHGYPLPPHRTYNDTTTSDLRLYVYL